MIIRLYLPPVKTLRKIRLYEPCSKQGHHPFHGHVHLCFSLHRHFSACMQGTALYRVVAVYPLHGHDHSAVKEKGSLHQCCLLKDILLSQRSSFFCTVKRTPWLFLFIYFRSVIPFCDAYEQMCKRKNKSCKASPMVPRKTTTGRVFTAGSPRIRSFSNKFESEIVFMSEWFL